MILCEEAVLRTKYSSTLLYSFVHEILIKSIFHTLNYW